MHGGTLVENGRAASRPPGETVRNAAGFRPERRGRLPAIRILREEKTGQKARFFVYFRDKKIDGQEQAEQKDRVEGGVEDVGRDAV